MALRAGVLTVGLTVAGSVGGASAALASTFYVNGDVATSGDCTSPGSACKTISEAVEKARLAPSTATIDVAAGTYTEDLALNQDGDAGLTIDGAGSTVTGGTLIEGVSGSPTIEATPINGGPTTIENLRIENPTGDQESALVGDITPLVANDVVIEMQEVTNGKVAVTLEQSTGTFDQLTVRGSWAGSAIQDLGSLTLTRSSLTTSTSASALVLIEGSTAGGHADVIRDSTIQSGPSAPMNVEAIGTDLTIDSSLLLGGTADGIEWIHPYQKERDLTVDGSTIDAGELGVRDPSTVNDLLTSVSGSTGAVGNVRVEGSILMEQQFAVTAPGEQLTVSCSYSDVPNQTQAASSGEGAIDCGNGVSGNTTSEPASLFVAPGTNYNLLAGSSAVDSVPAAAISLPFGLVPSTTDLAGNPRAVDGNGDCAVLQDKGAFELQGHSAACPSPPPLPIACAVSSAGGCPPLLHILLPALTGLTVSPSSFFAAPSGATISKAGKAKKAYGASVSYSDSQAATTTFTVLNVSQGRAQGKSCKEPSKANKHGKHCMVLTAVGSFSHADKAGANKFHFSGRLKGKVLAKGSYRLQAVPGNAGGNGLAVSKGFTIK